MMKKLLIVAMLTTASQNSFAVDLDSCVAALPLVVLASEKQLAISAKNYLDNTVVPVAQAFLFMTAIAFIITGK